MSLLEDDRSNYLAALHHEGKAWGLACVDHTTGEFTVAQYADMGQLQDEVARLSPSELLIPDHLQEEFGRIIDYFVGEYVAGRTPNPTGRARAARRWRSSPEPSSWPAWRPFSSPSC